MKFYLQQTGVSVSKIEIEIEDYVPLAIKFTLNPWLSREARWIALNSTDNLLEINFGIPYGEVYSLSCINRNALRVNDDFDRSHLVVSKISSLAFRVNNELEEDYSSLQQKTWFYFFNDSILIAFDDQLDKLNSVLNIDHRVSAVVDHKYQLKGVLFTEFTEEERRKLENFLTCSEGLFSCFDSVEIGGDFLMQLNDKIIKSIINLKNIDKLALLYDGLKKKIIDETFVIKTAQAMLDAGIRNDLVLEIAGFLKNQNNDLLAILEKKYSLNVYEAQEVYNETWFYLNSLQNIYQKGLL